MKRQPDPIFTWTSFAIVMVFCLPFIVWAQILRLRERGKRTRNL